MLTFIEEQIAPSGWEIHDPEMGLDFLLLCPHGDVVEQDGTCPDGSVSPMITLGLI